MPRITGPDGLTLQYEIAGSGEPVLLIHGTGIVETFEPMVEEADLLGRYQFITYARRGYAGSARTTGITSVEEHAADARTLLSNLDVERAHVVGHSYGGCVALQLALDAPHIVQSLALLEPALKVGTSAAAYRASLEEATDKFRGQGAAETLDEAFEARWPGYRQELDRVLPGAFDQAVADARAIFEHELPGLVAWSFGEEEARRVTQPVLSVLGGDSNALWDRFGETHAFLLEHVPKAQGFVLPGVTHFLQTEDPGGVAKALASFWADHPLGT